MKNFLIGLICGAIISGTLIYFIGNRYKVALDGPMAFKLDTCTGKSWMARYYEKEGHKIWYWYEMEDRDLIGIDKPSSSE